MTTDVLVKGIAQVVEGQNLSEGQVTAIMQQIMTGHSAPEQIAAFLTAMRMKGETIEEITGAVKLIRSLTSQVVVKNDTVIDIVGTGGDGASLFNVSTASAFICAAAGITVAKYGNYGFSSKSGSADVLKAASVNLLLTSSHVQDCIEALGIGFMLVQQHYASGKQLTAIRKRLGFRTFMNVMGPLTNPAGVKRQLVGVYEKDLCRKLAEVLAKTGSEHVMVVHSEDGLDEISPAAPTFVAEYYQGVIKEYLLDPQSLGIKHNDLAGLSVKGPEASLALIREALGGGDLSAQAKKAADMLALNGGAGIYLAGKASSFEGGVKKAYKVINSGEALVKLQALANFSQQFQSPMLV